MTSYAETWSESGGGVKYMKKQSHLPAAAVHGRLSLVSLTWRCLGKMLIHPHVDIQRFVMKGSDYLYLQRKLEG